MEDTTPEHHYSLERTRDGRLAHVSAVLPYGPDEGGLITDPEPAVARCLELLGERLAEAGFGLADVLKTTVYLTDLSWRESVNRVYARVVSPPMPARTAVEVRALPRGACIEIDAVVQGPEPTA